MNTQIFIDGKLMLNFNSSFNYVEEKERDSIGDILREIPFFVGFMVELQPVNQKNWVLRLIEKAKQKKKSVLDEVDKNWDKNIEAGKILKCVKSTTLSSSSKDILKNMPTMIVTLEGEEVLYKDIKYIYFDGIRYTKNNYGICS